MTSMNRFVASQQVRGQKLSRPVLQVLVSDIANGNLPANLPPTESEIVQRFSVSKTVAREVISQLETMRIIEVRHGRRMEIRNENEWDYLDPLLVESLEDPKKIARLLDELHELRLLVEPRAAEAAALLKPQLQPLEVLLETMRNSINDPDVYLEADVQFHAGIVKLSDNRLIEQLFTSVAALLRISRQATNLLPGALARATSDHELILSSISSGDSSGAARAMSSHLEWAPAAWSDA